MNKPNGYPDTPELDKMEGAKKRGSQEIGEFLEWLKCEPLNICEYDSYKEAFCPLHITTEAMLARYYGIDLDKVDGERMAILEWVRSRA